MSTLKQLIIVFAILGVIAVAQYVEDHYGLNQGLRVWGLFFLLVSVLYMFVNEIPVRFGPWTSSLTGWRKAYIIVPAFLIGLAISTFPHQVACSVHMPGHPCP